MQTNIGDTSDLPVFSSGGYTGDGGQFELAGIVHKGEYVLNKQTTSSLGSGYLNQLSQGKRIEPETLIASRQGGIGMDAVNLYFSPTINLTGSGSKEGILSDLQQALRRGSYELEKQIERIFEQRQRRSYTGRAF